MKLSELKALAKVADRECIDVEFEGATYSVHGVDVEDFVQSFVVPFPSIFDQYAGMNSAFAAADEKTTEAEILAKIDVDDQIRKSIKDAVAVHRRWAASGIADSLTDLPAVEALVAKYPAKLRDILAEKAKFMSYAPHGGFQNFSMRVWAMVSGVTLGDLTTPDAQTADQNTVPQGTTEPTPAT